MTEKQIYRRMCEAFNSHFLKYENEAEWWGNDDIHVWACSIPSLGIDVKMELNEELKRIHFFVRNTILNKKDFSYIDDANWEPRQIWTW